MNWQDKLISQLDQDQPTWFIDWAEQQALQSFARRVKDFPQDMNDAIRALKNSTIQKMGHRIINCALAQNIVKMPEA